MNVVVNGEPMQLARASTIASLLHSMVGEATEGVAVAVNDDVVPRGQWGERTLCEGDTVEVLQAVAGG